MLLVPVENQVRELDPKLLLACVAAAKGFPSVIGPRREVHFRIPSFQRSVYLSKSVTAASELVFRILRKLGHEVVAWDEEALVHLPDETYYSRRLSPTALGSVSGLFAWGRQRGDVAAVPRISQRAADPRDGEPAGGSPAAGDARVLRAGGGTDPGSARGFQFREHQLQPRECLFALCRTCFSLRDAREDPRHSGGRPEG